MTMATSFRSPDLAYVSEPDIIHDNNDSSPESSLHGFDFTTYIDCETSPWLSLEDGTPTPTASPSTTSSGAYLSEKPRTRRTSYNKNDDNETLKLNRRREQNRLSQKNFRQRKEKLYDEVLSQLEAEREVVSRLKGEVLCLQREVVNLQREKQTSLDAVVRLCRSMYDFPEVMGKYGHDG